MIKRILIITLVLHWCSWVLAKTFKTTDGVTIDYEVTGKGPPLVMLHSGMMSRDDMRNQIEYFSNNYQVIALDSREQGRSSVSSTQISYQRMANDVIELINYLKIKKVNMFGQSDGGITALLLSHYHPSRINKLIIHGAVYHYSAYSTETIASFKNLTWNVNHPQYTDVNRFPGNTIKSYLLGRSDLSQFESHLQEMARMLSSSPDLTIEDLRAIKLPVLIIVGDHGDVSLRHSIEMHEALGRSELFVVPGATHFVHREKPELLNKVIHDFLNDRIN